MAITATSSQPASKGWIVNGNSADFSGTEELRAAPGTGLALYLERVNISCNAAINITIGAGETGGAVTTIIWGPVYFAANTNDAIVFDRPVKLADNTSLTVDASGAGAATVVVQGFTA